MNNNHSIANAKQENNYATTSCSVPIWHKFALTVQEASAYFGIGTKKLRQIINESINKDFVLQIGAKSLIKRERFEVFLNETSSI